MRTFLFDDLFYIYCTKTDNNKKPRLVMWTIYLGQKTTPWAHMSSSSICEIKFYWKHSPWSFIMYFLWLLLHYNKKTENLQKRLHSLWSLKYLHSGSLQKKCANCYMGYNSFNISNWYLFFSTKFKFIFSLI